MKRWGLTAGVVALSLIALLLAVAGCGGSNDESKSSTVKRPSADPPAYHQTEYDVETTWPQVSSDKQVGGYRESVWHDPAVPEFAMVIDSRPEEGTEPPLARAELTRLQVKRMPGYKEFSFKKAKLGQNRALRWTYQVGATNYFAYFLSRCGVSFILHGTGPKGASDFDYFYDTVTERIKPVCIE